MAWIRSQFGELREDFLAEIRQDDFYLNLAIFIVGLGLLAIFAFFVMPRLGI